MVKCDVCNKESNKLIADSFWNQKVCEEHESDGTPECDACFRPLQNSKYLDLTDGRKLCSYCSSIAIMDPEDCKPLIRNVHEFYRGFNLKMDETIRDFLLDNNAMLEFEMVETDPDAMLQFDSLDIGCSLGGVWFSFSSVPDLERIEKCSKSEGSIEVKRTKEKLITRRSSSDEIEALMVKFGMSDLETGATVAHEMMHAWLYLKGVAGLEVRVEEGFCELMSYMWMEWFCSNGADSFNKTSEQVQHTRKLKEFLELDMENNEDNIYGQGFRDAKKAVSKFGFKAVLDHILKKRGLPQ